MTMEFTRQEFDQIARKVDNARRWGPDDELGTLNLITPEARVRALRLATTGEVVSCAEPWHVELGEGELTIPRIRPQLENHSNGLTGTQDHLEMNLHGKGSPTALKALNHIYFDGVTYNGITPEDRDADGVRRGGIQPGPEAVVTRGVLIDIPAVRGVEFVAPETPGTLADIEEALRLAKITVGPGDALFIRTGMPLSGVVPGPGAAVPGMSIDSAEWVQKSGVSLIVTDGGMDTHPSPVENVYVPWHVLACCFMGLRFVAHADLEALAARCAATGRYEFAAVVSVLPIPHATGSPANPVAIF